MKYRVLVSGSDGIPPKSVRDLIPQIQGTPQLHEATLRSSLREAITEKAHDIYPREITLGDLTDPAPRTWTAVRNFAVVRGENGQEYPGLKFSVMADIQYDFRRGQYTVEQLAPEKEVTVILTDKTTNIPVMESLIARIREAKPIQKNGVNPASRLHVEWGFDVEEDGSKIKKARVTRISEEESYRTEPIDNDSWWRCYRVLFSANGNLSDRKEKESDPVSG